MAKIRQKILIAYDRPDAIDALKNLFPQYDITTAADPHEAAQLAAQEDFALVITEYVVPSVSGIESITGKRPLQGESAREKASILKEFRTIMQETEGAERTASSANAVAQSQAGQEKILESLNNHVRQIDAERVELRLEVQRLHKELESTLQLKSELERDIALVRHEMARNSDALQEKISSLESELKSSIARTEAVQAEKAAIAGELRRVAEEADRTASGFNKKIDSLTALLNETFAEAEALRKVSADGREELARMTLETEEIVRGFQQQIKSLSEELGAAQAAIEAADSRTAEAEAESVRVKKESSNRISELNERFETLASDLSDAIAFAEQMAKERSEAEEKISSLEEYAGETEELKSKVDSLTEELKNMAAIVENAQKEKDRAEDKLSRLQLNWEKYIAAS